MPIDSPRQRPTLFDLEFPKTLAEVRPHLTDQENAQLTADLANGDVIQTFQYWRTVSAYRSDPVYREVVDDLKNRPRGNTVSVEDMAARFGITLPTQ